MLEFMERVVWDMVIQYCPLAASLSTLKTLWTFQLSTSPPALTILTFARHAPFLCERV